MKKKKWVSLLVAAILVFSLIPTTVLANETRESRTIDFSTFLEEIASAEYNYDGKGVTVEWSPSSACTDSRPDHTCLFDESAPQADGNNPQRAQGPNAQYHIFNGQENVKIENVNFKFNPADFTICLNSNWKGSFSKENIKNAELQMQNTGDVYFSGCSFDGVIVSPFSSATKSTFTDCDFNNVYNAYAIKDIYSPNASITGCTFDNCGGGIYFEGNAAKGNIIIQNNVFTNVDAYAEESKKFTRGLIQFSANGDYSNADITIADNTSTGEAATVRQLNTTITADVLDLDEVVENNKFAGNILTDSSFGTANTVYYNGTYYATLSKALTGVYMSSPQSTAKVYCKPGADVGAMTHGHVADDIIIYGNGAKVSAGERDLEIDTYKYDRTTGAQSKTGSFLDKDITVKVFDLNGIAAWGQRNTAHTVNLFFENCQNMQRIYFTNGNNQEGKINISLNDCSFDGSDDELKSNVNTAVYSNAPGDITISNTTFKDIAVALNINHKSAGVQNITLTDCIFEDCSLSDSSQAESTKTYAAPIRIVAKEGATTNLVIKDAEFIYSEGKKNCGNGDILIGDGRYDASETQGTVTLAMSGTQADIMVQKKGYYKADGTVDDTTKAKTTAVIESDVVLPNKDDHFEIDKHESIELVGKKDATCTEEGYTGDKVCTVCDKIVEKGTVIEKTAHNFQDGKCTVCGADDPNNGDKNSPETGDSSHTALWFALLSVSVVGLFGTAAYSKKRHANR